MSSGKCVHELVGERARQAPDRVALIANGRSLTYGELDSRASHLAHDLKRRGIGKETLVALCMQRSVDLVTAALGILMAGGAYVPFDPSYPRNRLSMLLEDSQVPLVIVQPGLEDKIPAGVWKTVTLDEVLSEMDVEESSLERVELENLAYIIFTSGSTGRPKGVQITHGNLLNLVSWHQREFQVTAADRATLHASPGFDASVWEMWPYLATGASIYVVDDAVRTVPEALRDWLVANEITVTFLPTALAESMIDLPWPKQSGLRFLLTGADTLRRRPPENLPFALINNYGPTECTVVATSGKVHHEGTPVPSIGKPIDNVFVNIVDDNLKPVSAGEVGELLVGGAGVGRGYLNAPELTAQKFVPDQFSKGEGARFYRTGDLGRYLPNGEIEFLGRVDEQVKIMGHRVEPREIKAVLDRHPAIKESFVTGYRDHSGTVRLLAYIVPADTTRLSPSELRSYLNKDLPDYMLPSSFIRLAEFPISSHGKLDRAALPLPDSTNTLSDDAFEPPKSKVEEITAGFVSRLIGVDRIGRDDNFFTLGGHSLMGAQLIAKVRETFGIDLPLRTLFDAPTIQGISAEIERMIYAKVAAMSEGEAQSILTKSA